MVRGVFFDAGNTILFPDYDIYRRIAASFGVDVDIGDVIRAEALARSAFDSAVASSPTGDVSGFWSVYYAPFYERLGVPAGSIDRAIEMTRDANDRGLGIWRVPVDGFDEVMHALGARGVTVGIVSNSDGRLEERLSRIGIRDRFAFVLDSVVVGVSKPDPRIFEMALERSSLSASDVVYVGDYYVVDVVGARRAGIRPLLFDPYGIYPDVDCDVVRRFVEVVDVVERWGGQG